MFHDIEQKIVDRLKAVLPPEVTIGTEVDLETVEELRQRAPAAWVIYDGYSVGDLITTGAVQKINQDWFVVVCAKSAKGRGKSTEARDQAGTLAAQVLAALLGLHLGGARYLRLGDAPGPVYDAGYCHMPLAFQNAATFKGDQTS